MVEYKHGGTRKPLTIELTPHGLAPAGVSYGQVEGAFVKVVPEYTCCQVPHGIQIVVCHHLRLATGTAGKIHQHRIVIGVHKSGLHKFRSLLPLRLPVMESFRDGLAVIGNRDILLHRRTLVLSSLNLANHVGIVHTDDGLHGSTRVAIYNVVLGQHVGSRNHDGTDFV